MYEITADQEHINLIKKALQSYLCSIYDALDEEVVDVDKAHEDIKVLSDMLAVLKGQNTYQASSDKVDLMWMKEVYLPQPIARCEDEMSEITDEQISYLISRQNHN